MQCFFTCLLLLVLLAAPLVLPFRQRPFQEESYASLGVRRLFVGNYIIFYSAVERSGVVYILRVLYKRRE